MADLEPLDPASAEVIAGWVTSRAEATLAGGPQLPWPLTGEILLGIDADPSWQVFVLRDPAGTVVASGSFFTKQEGRRLRIGRVIVGPSRRGEGWGRVLMEALLAEADSRPAVEYTELAVFEHNTVARDLYGKLGFAETGEVRPVAVDDQTWLALEMERPTPSAG